MRSSIRANASNADFSDIDDIVSAMRFCASRATLARDEEILLALGLFDLVVQIAERVLELFRLDAVLLPRLLELLAVGHVLALAHERLLGEIVAPFLDGEHRLVLPVVRLLEFGVGLVAQALLVGDGRGDLLLRLGELRPHVDENLVEHLLGIFGPRDQIVDVRPQQGRETIEDAHGSACLAVRAELAEMRRERDGDALVRREEFLVVEVRQLERFGHDDRVLLDAVRPVHEIAWR